MKTLISAIIVNIVIFANSMMVLFSEKAFHIFKNISNWLNNTSFLDGHSVTGIMTNGTLILCMTSPLIVASMIIGIIYSQYKAKTNLKFKRA